MSENPLQGVLDRVERSVAAGVLPVVVFDLDSTLLDNYRRNLRILREFAHTEGHRYPGLEPIVDLLTEDELGYDMRDTLRERGFDDQEAFAAFFAFWKARFFTDEYVLEDVPAPGAADYVRACHDRGAYVYYLTGRNTGGMEFGTARSLQEHGFPLFRGRATLHLKPSFEMGDGEFKDLAVADIESLHGEVVATFENEPGHANLYARTFPGATHFLRDSVHSPTAPEPDPRLVHHDDFVV